MDINKFPSVSFGRTVRQALHKALAFCFDSVYGLGVNCMQAEIRPPVEVISWCGGADDGFLRLLDQTRLPGETAYVDCRDVPTLTDSIRRLVVRGAPAIGVAAGYGMVLAAQKISPRDDTLAALQEMGEEISSARPTAVNLSWAVNRVLKAAKDAGGDIDDIRRVALAEARTIRAEDEKMCLAIGRNAAELISGCSGVLTHCNAGALATAGIGTATAGMYVAHAAGCIFRVYCDETRPLLQGSRLTAWELSQAGIDTVLITDSMAGQVMSQGGVQMVITGADRIAANGDTANKIGTYTLAVLARHNNIPFYVAAPYSTFDMSIADGGGIPIEQRAAEEVTHWGGRQTAPDGVKTYSPAFDVTPAELITAIITDRGIIKPVNADNISKIIS